MSLSVTEGKPSSEGTGANSTPAMPSLAAAGLGRLPGPGSPPELERLPRSHPDPAAESDGQPDRADRVREPVSLDPHVAARLLADLDFVVFDLETTGWSSQDDAITEIGAVRVHGDMRTGEFASLVNPGIPVPAGIEELTGISDWLLSRAPTLCAVMPRLFRFADGAVLVAHNAPFDLSFLTAACTACGLVMPRFTVLDTVMLARELLSEDEVPDRKLATLAAFFGTRTAPSHRALADARATAEVFGSLLDRLASRGIRTLGQLNELPEVVVA